MILYKVPPFKSKLMVVDSPAQTVFSPLIEPVRAATKLRVMISVAGEQVVPLLLVIAIRETKPLLRSVDPVSYTHLTLPTKA